MQRVIAVCTFVALLCACGADNAGDAADPDRTVPLPPSQIQLTAALTPFESCEPFLRHVKTNALDMVSPWGIGGGYFPETMEAEMLRGSPQAIADSATSVPEVDYSTTNIQEAGVDEPDIVKTDGRRIVALVDNTLHVIDATGQQLQRLGEFEFKKFWAQDMFLSDDRVVVFGQMHDTTPLLRSVQPRPGWHSPITTLMSVDISESMPRITRRLHIDGSYISSRLVNNAARIVIQSNPTGLEWVYPNGSGLRAERDAKEQNRQLIEESTIDNWVPWFALEN
ncbi:MAG: beta-propeller domain-containing protein [Candidatus Poriferisodalaceae bacterium]